MRLTLHVKALSVNDAFRGRHFPTAAKKQYEESLHFALPKAHVAPGPFYRIAYDFYLVRFSTTDWDNCVKITQDCLVRRGIITDDRLIVDARVRKFPSKENRIEIEIEAAALPETQGELLG
jgi:Holliday junction resolvase RusA-like endonuclease